VRGVLWTLLGEEKRKTCGDGGMVQMPQDGITHACTPIRPFSRATTQDP
jgi:hypothetical protein